MLVRGLPVAHLLRGFSRRFATAIVSYGTTGGVHKDGLTALNGQHAFWLHTLLGATYWVKKEIIYIKNILFNF